MIEHISCGLQKGLAIHAKKHDKFLLFPGKAVVLSDRKDLS
jgi:hypothetical protein